ncbi:hypothetical protein K440DRAFT_659626 [Wilcoxina mikolae CBS 423.85]|nr:hypothetical protein K440DRAFT_659626 [Wilcoxina mikolae CBS 423.85]
MPKRTREEEAKPTPRLSAVAQRRLREQQIQQSPTPVVPESAVKVRKTKSTAQKRHEETVFPPADVSNDELVRKRAEIEQKLRERVSEVKALERDPMRILSKDWSTAQMSPASNASRSREGSPVSKPSPTRRDTPSKTEESALARIKREREKKKLSATTDDEDVEMKSVGGSDEDEIMESGAESTTPKLTQVSSFVPTDENYSVTDSASVFRLQPGETLVLVGVYQITVTKGSVNISGAKLSPSSPTQTIYASMTHALPVIEAISSKRKQTTNSGTPGAEIRITNHHSDILEIGKLCPTFNTIWKGSLKDLGGNSFAPIFTSATSIPIVAIPTSWKPTLKALTKKAASTDASPPIIVLAGSKGTGKSTFSRILANRLLTTAGLDSIAYLDVDPGQPEFSPPGIISLSVLTCPILGPPFTHTLTATRSHHIGYTSPREDPAHYIRAIIDLLSVYRQSYPTVPLLINTAGWTKGLGLELLQDILSHSQATDIVFLGGGAAVIAEIIAPNTTTLHELSSAAVSSSSSTRFTPADLRTLHTMSYFHRLSSGRWDFTTPLTGFAPWVIPYTGAARGIDGVHILGEEAIAAEELCTAIEGTIVGIVVVAEHNLPESFTPTPSSLSSAGDELLLLPAILESPLAPDVAECKGLAVIRAIDLTNGHVHLISSVGESEIEEWECRGERVVLVRGRLELSVWEMLLPNGGGAAATEKELPWISTGEGKRSTGAVWRVRRNVMRRGQR